MGVRLNIEKATRELSEYIRYLWLRVRTVAAAYSLSMIDGVIGTVYFNLLWDLAFMLLLMYWFFLFVSCFVLLYAIGVTVRVSRISSLWWYVFLIAVLIRRSWAKVVASINDKTRQAEGPIGSQHAENALDSGFVPALSVRPKFPSLAWIRYRRSVAAVLRSRVGWSVAAQISYATLALGKRDLSTPH